MCVLRRVAEWCLLVGLCFLPRLERHYFPCGPYWHTKKIFVKKASKMKPAEHTSSHTVFSPFFWGNNNRKVSFSKKILTGRAFQLNKHFNNLLRLVSGRLFYCICLYPTEQFTTSWAEKTPTSKFYVLQSERFGDFKMFRKKYCGHKKSLQVIAHCMAPAILALSQHGSKRKIFFLPVTYEQIGKDCRIFSKKGKHHLDHPCFPLPL